MKVYEGANIRNVAVIGHGHAGKTSLVSAMLYAAGANQRHGPCGRRHLHHRLRRGRNRPQDVDFRQPRPRGVGQNENQYRGYARLQHVRPRSQAGAAGGRCGDRCRRWRGRRRSRHPAGVELLRGISDAAPDRGQPHGSRPRRRRPRSGIPHQCLRPVRDSSRVADRQREKLSRRGRSGHAEGLHATNWAATAREKKSRFLPT